MDSSFGIKEENPSHCMIWVLKELIWYYAKLRGMKLTLHELMSFSPFNSITQILTHT
jgi:hypothetical protein